MTSLDSEDAEHLLVADQIADGTETHPSGTQVSDLEFGKIRTLLYTSHFLSTWNSRVFEFGAFLFLANIYPQTLLPASVYALARAASAALLSPWIGSYIDSANRLQIVRLSIIGQRFAVATSCVGLFLMTQYESLRLNQFRSTTFLAILSLLACLEKLSWVSNTISIERDWVIIIASGHEERLRVLNSQMRRIDLLCKLMGPLMIALVDSASSRIAILATGAMTTISVLVEYFTIVRVYDFVPALGASKITDNDTRSTSRTFGALIRNMLAKSSVYIRHPAMLPSLSLALLYLTVLSFAGQMITYLIALGLPSALIGALRGVSAFSELSATWIAPRLMARIGPIRAGLWFLHWQIFCVTVACLFFWLDHNTTLTAIGSVSAVIASRVGLWGYDLSAQIIVQEEVQADIRGTFSSQEFALQNIFEMLAFASTIAFPQPAQFKYPATISAVATGLAGVLYAGFVRTRRGHLVHLSRCADRNRRQKESERRLIRVSDREIERDEGEEYELNPRSIDCHSPAE